MGEGPLIPETRQRQYLRGHLPIVDCENPHVPRLPNVLRQRRTPRIDNWHAQPNLPPPQLNTRQPQVAVTNLFLQKLPHGSQEIRATDVESPLDFLHRRSVRHHM